MHKQNRDATPDANTNKDTVADSNANSHGHEYANRDGDEYTNGDSDSDGSVNRHEHVRAPAYDHDAHDHVQL